MSGSPSGCGSLTTDYKLVYKTAFLVGAYKEDLDTIDELAALADTYGVEVTRTEKCKLRKIDAGTYIGKGKLAEFMPVDEEVIIFDADISPSQQRNLEKAFNKPVMDRTELIIEVFAQRAHTKEARLQVELAKSRYLLPRLKRMWTHLSRQSSGGGAFVKGEGEKQIELDKRMISQRITALRREIAEVTHHRQVQRAKRLRSEIPTFAIVGYTNSGKSTLLNALTNADVLEEDKLFATLDTTTRRFTLPNHQPVLFIDTVGFVRHLPHSLVNAFKSTLEEAIYTDILLHVVDVSNPDAVEQADTTFEVLKELGAGERPMITVLNKIDAAEDKDLLAKFRVNYPNTVPISAKNHEGFEDLFHIMERELKKLRKTLNLRIPQSHYALVSELMSVGTVHSLEYEENDVILDIEIPSHLEHKVLQFIE
ncbi:MAG: GTPase HflX [Chlamydiia bacterium]|nr:GTPase HflX [Chlamydiia bacterium]MCH9615990.1 GTPase HflX [Chlamydiia bacterium]MCH9629013.1 GTPase HflX [Chlamydiia bacterium]